ncbi:hypothetical protein NEFER03_0211 [Nematocida sp. LUAm3]|nr:hypothetical protein NEFER03_0211 [Nematocida sp. LUAm3]KAI5173664.1 hypothetical protein NEFER02_0180 [Nematocida sp. LUAm2]KAI5176885.1 hypothetical protein NEFER01_0210 [Nematocida sp. LUAm1]
MQRKVLSLRVPPRASLLVETEEGRGIFLPEWPEVDASLNEAISLLLKEEDLHKQEISILVRSVLSPDPRERSKTYYILTMVLSKNKLNRYLLLNILTEFLTEEIDPCGVELIISLMNILGPKEQDILEVYIPLLTKRLNPLIREEITTGICEVYSNNSIYVYKEVLKHCRRFSSSEVLCSVEIIENLLIRDRGTSLEGAKVISEVFSIFLQQEHHLCLERLFYLLSSEETQICLIPYSKEVVEILFPSSYYLSQKYWKKTYQYFACMILQVLFSIDPKAFDDSLQLYNRRRYVGI